MVGACGPREPVKFAEAVPAARRGAEGSRSRSSRERKRRTEKTRRRGQLRCC